VLDVGGVLLLGDLSAAAERKFLRSEPKGVQVLILAHHGSRFSSSEELLEALAPELGVVSAGRNNTYGHPHAQTLERFQSRGIPVLSTAVHGTIQLRPGPQLTLRHHQPGFGWSAWLSPDEQLEPG
jgi:competence protein ComEC